MHPFKIGLSSITGVNLLLELAMEQLPVVKTILLVNVDKLFIFVFALQNGGVAPVALRVMVRRHLRATLVRLLLDHDVALGFQVLF